MKADSSSRTNKKQSLHDSFTKLLVVTKRTVTLRETPRSSFHEPLVIPELTIKICTEAVYIQIAVLMQKVVHQLSISCPHKHASRLRDVQRCNMVRLKPAHMEREMYLPLRIVKCETQPLQAMTI
ncbi:uncharacterized protein PHALS_06196 [Plasmopara halstedii]|uniref:Uncharacterized protein n=1 Tax=Plasmopara halstedii TaxID=4781 RepID=A0A0N7L7Y5_PLAHL|nr:uncharacterized protein PHALS_06196 [Plasmopara halstedii]CEG48371.1 hypothetical protein PHALS_06196 [Plasmopara halstedii]|eukprot:XP_024584740.1 hypothetical protein PHALS_06196 [Plasmopara halstedii]